MPINHEHVQNMPMIDEHVKKLGFRVGQVGEKDRNIYSPVRAGWEMSIAFELVFGHAMLSPHFAVRL